MKLTKAVVAKLALPAGKSDLIVFDEDLSGFGLRLRAGGSAVWITQYRVGVQQRRVTLGRLATLDPDRARKAAREVLAKADLGQDIQAERVERQARAVVTFGTIAEHYIAYVTRTKRPRTQVETKRHLNRHWLPFHGRPVHEIGRRDVAARLQVLAGQHGPIASNRARAALSACYAWAIGQGLADVNPVVGTTRVGVERERERVLAGDEIAVIWPLLGEEDHSRIAKLLLLTGQRRGEVAGMLWEELDLERGQWSLPGVRTKNGLPHEVPLSRQAVALLRSAPVRPDRDLLFGDGDGPFSGWSRAKKRLDLRISRARAEARLGRQLGLGEQPWTVDALPPWTLHDLRRTVVTGMNELGIQPHVVEAVVNHISGRAKAGVAGVYNRATYANEKRMALQAWADHLDTILGLGERRVIPMRA
jgi:integrase